jgi:hypothetical protein
VNPEKSITRYVDAYKSLYRREPSDICDLGGNWIQVNGARISSQELDQLTLQLLREVQDQTKLNKRTLVQRLVKWLST